MIIGNTDATHNWQGVLCCKCHKLTLVPSGESPPEKLEEDCYKRWQQYGVAVDAYIKDHGPPGG
jgi:hypothetical protein